MIRLIILQRYVWYSWTQRDFKRLNTRQMQTLRRLWGKHYSSWDQHSRFDDASTVRSCFIYFRVWWSNPSIHSIKALYHNRKSVIAFVALCFCIELSVNAWLLSHAIREYQPVLYQSHSPLIMYTSAPSCQASSSVPRYVFIRMR